MALRWSIVFFLTTAAFLAFTVLVLALAHKWTWLVIALVLLCASCKQKWAPIRANIRELARRHR
jgi:hypothetical protein